MGQCSKKEAYLNELMEQIRCKKARSFVAEEYAHHIEDQAASFEEAGDDKETALSKAIEQMGDPAEAGKQLDKIHRPRMEWNVLGIVMTLCCIGLFTMQSMGTSFTKYTGKHILFIVIGFLIMTAIYFLDYTIIGRYPKIVWFLFIAGFYLYGPFGTRVNGSIQYLYAYGLLFVPLYGGVLYAYRNKGYRGLIKCLLVVMITSLIESQFIRQSSVYLGILAAGLIMLSAAVMKNWFHASRKVSLMLVWGCVPIAELLLYITGLSFRPYQLERMKSSIQIMLHPEQYPHGYQINIVRQVMNHAKIFGGNNEYISRLPVIKNDYILTYIIGKWGIAAGVLMIGLILGFIVRMLYISYRQKNTLGMFVGIGCSLVFGIQSIIYILSNLSFALIAQVNLPFLSYGGSSMLINFVMLGLILSVFRNTDIMKEKPYQANYRLAIVKRDESV